MNKFKSLEPANMIFENILDYLSKIEDLTIESLNSPRYNKLNFFTSILNSKIIPKIQQLKFSNIFNLKTDNEAKKFGTFLIQHKLNKLKFQVAHVSKTQVLDSIILKTALLNVKNIEINFNQINIHPDNFSLISSFYQNFITHLFNNSKVNCLKIEYIPITKMSLFNFIQYFTETNFLITEHKLIKSYYQCSFWNH